MMRKWMAMMLLGLAALAPGYGQGQKPAGKTIVLKAARLFDGKSDALVKPGIVVVTDGKIVAAGTSAAIPAGAEVIDMGDATLLPGFIDAHTHLTFMYTEDYKQKELDRLQKNDRGACAGRQRERAGNADGGDHDGARRRFHGLPGRRAAQRHPEWKSAGAANAGNRART